MITPPVILLIIVVVALVLIFIIPKMKKSTKLDNLNDGLFGSMDKSSTDSIINKVEQGKDALVDKIKQNADKVKDALADSDKINKTLDK